MRARYYDPTTAQFLTRDPMVSTTRSAYGYTGNDPLNGSDPSGLWDYYKHYDLGASSLSVGEFVQGVAAWFGDLFPVPGHAGRLYEGESMALHMGPVPFHVRVSRLDDTGWTFATTLAHVDFPGFISFNFSQDSDCHLHLDVHGNVQGLGELYGDNWLTWLNPAAPLVHLAYLESANQLWGSLASNLRGFNRKMSYYKDLAGRLEAGG